jgi:hypothetical protein
MALCPQCFWDCGIERRHQVFERRLDGFERLRSFDPNVFDLYLEPDS